MVRKDRGGSVRTRDLARLARLRELLETIHGEPLSRSATVDSAIAHMLSALGTGADLATFSVAALQGIMAARTRQLVEGIAEAVEASLTEHLHNEGLDAEMVISLSEDGRTIAAKVVSAARMQLPLPIGDDRIHPTIEA